MNKVTTILILLFSASALFSEDTISNLGFKGGLNCGEHTPNKTARPYQYQFGFYIGEFYRIQMEGKSQFQPELWFALHASKISTKENAIADFDGNPSPYTSSFNFQHTSYEATGSISPVLKLNRLRDFFCLDSGPKFRLIIDRTYAASQDPMHANDTSFVKEGSANFDFGACLGTGYKISKKVQLT